MAYQKIFGIEIECILNNELNSNDYDDDERTYYLNNEELNLWDIKGDMSLNTYCDYKNEYSFNNGSCLEFVTPKLNNKESFFNSLKEFENKISHNGKYELFKVLDFNSSCGLHIHFTLNKKEIKLFKDKMVFLMFKEMREMFFKKIKESKLLKEDTKKSILKHYFRHYSKRLTEKETNKNYNNDRYFEFNFVSERINKGMEWRSFNLNSVTTWKEFNECFKIGYECITFLLRGLEKGYKTKEIKKNFSTKLKKLNHKIVKFNFENKIINITENKPLNKNKVLNLQNELMGVFQCVI